MMYYADKVASLKDVFGAREVSLALEKVVVDGKAYPIIDDVIILLDPAQYPPSLRKRLAGPGTAAEAAGGFAEDIQFTFGEEWQKYPNILPEHRAEFEQYFDLIDLRGLKNARVCDLGCGIGRWSYFLRDRCKEQVLVDFSEAIFVARRNLKDAPRALFFMGDLTRLPFRSGFADLLFCLGVLHHLPLNALKVTRDLKRFAPRLLIYLYYALDNRPFHYRVLLSAVTCVRLVVSRVRNDLFRSVFTVFVACCVYWPMVMLGHLFDRHKLGRFVPLFEGNRDKSIARLKQDVYDRFFTRIEQRVSRKEVLALKDTFDQVIVSEGLPYWHFVCLSGKGAGA